MIDLAADLELIRQAAIDAGALALAEREAGLTIEAKPGGSPVTSGDLKVDAMLRECVVDCLLRCQGSTIMKCLNVHLRSPLCPDNSVLAPTRTESTRIIQESAIST